MAYGVCNVVERGCKAPPATPTYTRGSCFACGNTVCTSPGCSKRVSYYRYGTKRVCAHCQEEHADGIVGPNSRKVVILTEDQIQTLMGLLNRERGGYINENTFKQLKTALDR